MTESTLFMGLPILVQAHGTYFDALSIELNGVRYAVLVQEWLPLSREWLAVNQAGSNTVVARTKVWKIAA
jgi:hypothetical protein